MTTNAKETEKSKPELTIGALIDDELEARGGLTPVLADGLAAAFGISPQLFLNLALAQCLATPPPADEHVDYPLTAEELSRYYPSEGWPAYPEPQPAEPPAAAERASHEETWWCPTCREYREVLSRATLADCAECEAEMHRAPDIRPLEREAAELREMLGDWQSWAMRLVVPPATWFSITSAARHRA